MSEAKLKQPPVQPPKAASAGPAIRWEHMSTVPKDGRPVFLRRGNSNEAVECFWRTSRKFDTRSTKWSPFSYWSRVIGPYTMIDFEPQGWFRDKDHSKEPPKAA